MADEKKPINPEIQEGIERQRSAQETARWIIDKLDPEHITGFNSLRLLLDLGMKRIKQREKLFETSAEMKRKFAPPK